MAKGVNVQPELLRWALDRAHLAPSDLEKAFPQYEDWESGDRRPTMRQLERFAKRTHTPLGLLFLAKPPVETLPIPDFRTVKDKAVAHPSPDLLQTIYTMQQRQAWAREFLIDEGAEPLDFVGSASLDTGIEGVASMMRQRLGLQDAWAAGEPTWTAALSALIERIEDAGVMVMLSGVVDDDTHRPLDVTEFRGFVLCDDYAPLVFLNNRDAKSAQMFTLAHELAHVWIGQGGVSNLDHTLPSNHAVERFCNRVAAEFLVPAQSFEQAWKQLGKGETRFDDLAKRFKVSRIVAVRRALDLRHISRTAFFEFYEECQREEGKRRAASEGGNYYDTKHRKLGDRFSRLVLRAVRSQRLSFAEAYRLTGLRGATFDKYSTQFGGAA